MIKERKKIVCKSLVSVYAKEATIHTTALMIGEVGIYTASRYIYNRFADKDNIKHTILAHSATAVVGIAYAALVIHHQVSSMNKYTLRVPDEVKPMFTTGNITYSTIPDIKSGSDVVSVPMVQIADDTQVEQLQENKITAVDIIHNSSNNSDSDYTNRDEVIAQI